MFWCAAFIVMWANRKAGFSHRIGAKAVFPKLTLPFEPMRRRLIHSHLREFFRS